MSETESLMRGLYEHLIVAAKKQGFNEELAQFKKPIEEPIKVRTNFDTRLGGSNSTIRVYEALILANSRKLLTIGFGEEYWRRFGTSGRVVIFAGVARPAKRVKLVEDNGQKKLTRVVDETSEETLKSLLREDLHRFNPAPTWGKFYQTPYDLETLSVDCWGNSSTFGGPEIGRAWERWDISRLATPEGLAQCERVLTKIIKDAQW